MLMFYNAISQYLRELVDIADRGDVVVDDCS